MKNAQDQRRRDPLGRGVYVRCHTAAGVPSRRDILETRLVREGTIMGDKCPTSGERSRHGERLRLIGGRIRACSCTYIGGKYHDDAWVHYLLGGQSLEPRPWSGRAFPTQVRRHSPLSIFLFPRCSICDTPESWTATCTCAFRRRVTSYIVPSKALRFSYCQRHTVRDDSLTRS